MTAENVVVIGASAGGIAALQLLVRGLPPTLPAAVLVVLHISPTHQSSLPEILSRAGTLTASFAVHRENLEAGRIYVAPPDRHLTVANQQVHVVFGPRENLFRPAIDPLFRSAAITFPGRVIGILLSGGLDDGCSGLNEIERRGGLTIVQDPNDAEVPTLPLNALRRVRVDYTLPVSKIAETIVSVLEASNPGPEFDSNSAPHIRTVERKKESSMPTANGQRSFDGITCPECHGPIFEDKNSTAAVSLHCGPRVLSRGHASRTRPKARKRAVVRDRRV